jgi:hypothetical protein
MPNIDRRSALAIGLGIAAVVPAALRSSPARAAMYGKDEGQEVAPGVRVVRLTEKHAHIPAYQTVSLRDVVFEPGSKIENPSMRNDMVCHTIEGALYIDNGGGDEFDAPTGQVWSCAKDQYESAENRGDVPAVMRIIDLIEA